MVSLIFSGLALLAAAVSLGLTIQEKKRSKKRNAAVLQYVDEHTKAVLRQVDDRYGGRIRKLEEGIAPDYAQAKAAADAVNDFNRGIVNILNFDPLEALRRERSREGE